MTRQGAHLRFAPGIAGMVAEAGEAGTASYMAGWSRQAAPAGVALAVASRNEFLPAIVVLSTIAGRPRRAIPD